MRAQASLKLTVSALLGFVLGAMVCYWRPDGCPELRGPRRRDGIQKSDCVCGGKIERHETSSIGQFHNLPRQKGPPIAKPELPEAAASLLKEFLYPSNKTPVLNVKGQHYKPGSQYEPVLLREEYLYKKMVFVGVLTQQAYLSTRAKYLYETWGRDVDELVFFVGEDCVVPPDLVYLPIIKLPGIPDNVYPPLRKTFAVLQYMYDNYLNQFNWFIRADDDMYVRTKLLKELLMNMLPYEKVYLGRAGTGRKDDLDRLYLLSHERYCMGGPGIILSMNALRELGPHLADCLNAVLLYSKTGYNDDDVEVGRCVSRKINIQCSSSAESRRYFLFDYSGEALNPVTLWTKPSFQNLITIHPVKNPENMLSVHHFYKTLDFEREYEGLHETADYLNKLCRQLPPHVAPPLSASAGCNLKLHPHLAYFNMSSKMNHRGLAPSGYLMPREKVPFYLKPVDKFDVQSWTHFNDSSVQEMSAISPEFSPHGTLLAEIRHILGMLRPYVRIQHAPQEVEIKHILDGYMRFNPHLGREYILTLKLSTSKLSMYKRYHIVREIGPQVSVVDLPVVQPKLTVNVIVPVEKADASFKEFLKSFGHTGLKYSGNKVHLVAVVFSKDIAEKVEDMLRRFTDKTFPLSVSIATGSGAFSSLRAFDIGMATLEDDSSLAFLASVGLRFAPGFFRRCRSNTELGSRVYFPSPFWLYQSDFTNRSDGNVPLITSWTGQWASYDFAMACIYKKDYDTVGGYRNKKYSVELFESVISRHYDVMQAPEPGLFKLWQRKQCWRLGSARRKKICSDLKKGAGFEQAELADYLGEWGAVGGDFIQAKQSLS